MPFKILIAALLLLSTVSLQAAGLSPPAQQALDAIEQGALDSQSDAVLVVIDGTTVLQRTSQSPPKPIETMSATKSVVALAIGALLSDGKLESLDTPVHSYYPEWNQGRKKQITIRMLMDHSSGLQNLPRPAIEIYPASDVIQLALAAELSDDPGARFLYNNKAMNLLAGIIAKISGMPMDQYVQERLFAPMKIKPGEWFKDAAGNPHAMAGLFLNAEDMAKIGQLVLDRGQWQGKPLVREDFIDTMLAPSKLSNEVGLLWWRRVAWVRFHADEASLAMLEKVGARAELIQSLRPLVGRKFANEDELYQALAETMGENWSNTWREELILPHGIGPWKPFHPEKGPVDTFEANGSLGQYIVVIPKARLIAVRQIEYREDLNWMAGYADFTQRVQALANALIASAQPAP